MNIHEKYINRCISIAKNGLGTTYPNPMVGAVIVYQDTIIAEGYTSPYTGPHAEVNAIAQVKDKEILKKATLYVSLEPCSHFGKTPPCADLIIAHKIPRVVIGTIDTFSKVAGRGIKKLMEAGIEVVLGVLEEKCIASNKRFFTFHDKKRPFIILKWAQSKDGFLDRKRDIPTLEQAKPLWITNAYTRQLVHKWRGEEHAILVGTNTVLKDNPSLDCRAWHGENPIRVIIDRQGKIPKDYAVFNSKAKTIICTQEKQQNTENLFYEFLDFTAPSKVVVQICAILYKHNIHSVLIEGGGITLQAFIDANIWDQARVCTGDIYLQDGIKAPTLYASVEKTITSNTDTIVYYNNTNTCK